MSTALRERYASLSDSKLRQLALDEGGGLTPDARVALCAELESRDLDIDLDKVFGALEQAEDGRQLHDLARRYQNCPCPVCGKKTGPLSAIRFEMIAAPYFFGILTREKSAVGCPACLRKAQHEVSGSSTVFGILAGPIGWIRLFLIAGRHDKAIRDGERGILTPHYLDYVRQNAGKVALEVDRNDEGSVKFEVVSEK